MPIVSRVSDRVWWFINVLSRSGFDLDLYITGVHGGEDHHVTSLTRVVHLTTVERHNVCSTTLLYHVTPHPHF